jgi:hypothetical protein
MMVALFGGDMTRKERAQLDRLQDENRHLHEQIDRHMELYRKQLYQIVAMQARYDRINKLCTEIAGVKR